MPFKKCGILKGNVKLVVRGKRGSTIGDPRGNRIEK